MSGWVWVKVKDLRVGDVVRWYVSGSEPPQEGEIVDIRIVPVAERPTWWKTAAIREITVRTWEGIALVHGGLVSPNGRLERRGPKEAQERQKAVEEILQYRVGVRTVLSRCETDIVRWKNDKPSAQMAPYLAEYEKIFKKLEKLDQRMTKDAGRDDERKPVHPRGHRR